MRTKVFPFNITAKSLQ